MEDSVVSWLPHLQPGPGKTNLLDAVDRTASYAALWAAASAMIDPARTPSPYDEAVAGVLRAAAGRLRVGDAQPRDRDVRAALKVAAVWHEQNGVRA